MNEQKLVKKGLEIAEKLFSTDDFNLSASELNLLVGAEESNYLPILIKGLTTIHKISPKSGRAGGIRYVSSKNSRASLSLAEKKEISNLISRELKAFLKKKERKNPESAVEKGFFQYLQSEERLTEGIIINSRSSARARGKWKNVDGYKIEPINLKYHFLFKPSLTSYEVKAGYPTEPDVAQARKYLEFSNSVYLVFKDAGSAEKVRARLYSSGIMKPNDEIGVYVTSDNKNYVKLKEAVYTYPNEKDLDKAIHELLSENDRTRLKIIKSNYLKTNLIDLLTLND